MIENQSTKRFDRSVKISYPLALGDVTGGPMTLPMVIRQYRVHKYLDRRIVVLLLASLKSNQGLQLAKPKRRLHDCTMRVLVHANTGSKMKEPD